MTSHCLFVASNLEQVDEPPEQASVLWRRLPRRAGTLSHVERIGGEYRRDPGLQRGEVELTAREPLELDAKLVELQRMVNSG